MTIRHPYSSEAQAHPQHWFAKLLQRPDRGAAEAAVERMLAGSESGVPSRADITTLFDGYRVSGGARKEIGMALWGRALLAFIDDDVVTDEEMTYLTALRAGFGLRERDTEQLYAEIVSGVYSSALIDALSDATLSDVEYRQLDIIASGLRLPRDLREQISEQPIAEAMSQTFKDAIADHRITPAEMARLNAVAANLGVGPSTFGPEAARLIERLALLWRIENEDLPVCDAPVNLQKGEVCHHMVDISWHELRTRTLRTYRSGPVASIRIMKGLSYRVGATQSHRVTTDELVQIDTGTAYITNKRIIFDGSRKNASIRYNSILSLTPYSDGFTIEKGSGKSPTLIVQGDAEIATMIVAEALSRS
jgi:hypothetical protein